MSSIDRFIKRFGGRIRALMVLGPLPFVLPVFPIINAIWTALFALPFWLVVRIFQPHPVYADHPATEVAAIFLWPPLLLFLMIWGSGKILLSESKWRNGVVMVWLGSLCALVSPQFILDHLPQWPVFGVFD